MAEWRVGGKLKRTLYRDEQLVGLVDTAEIAGEIVETMNRVGRLLDEVRPVERQRREAAENARERSRECIHCDSPARPGSPSCGECPDSQDAQRRSEATPQKDLDLSRVDPYDTTKGGRARLGLRDDDLGRRAAADGHAHDRRR